MGKKGTAIILVFCVVSAGACRMDPQVEKTPIPLPGSAEIEPSPDSSYTPSPGPVSTRTPPAAFLDLLSSNTPVITPTRSTQYPPGGTRVYEGSGAASFEDQQDIEAVVWEYFDRRYEIFSISNPEGIPDDYFDDLLSASPDAADFLELELAKLRMVLKQRELNNLHYTAYEYFLEFDGISVDETRQEAVVSLSKRDNIIFELSLMIASGEPIISSSANEEHTILLKKEDGGWKIVSDTYSDFVWRMLRKSGAQEDEILNTLDQMTQNLENAEPQAPPDCFRGDPESWRAALEPEPGESPLETLTATPGRIEPNVERIYFNFGSFEPGWGYPNPFINLYFRPGGNSPLRVIVELEGISEDEFFLNNKESELSGWKIVFSPIGKGDSGEKSTAFLLDLDKRISCSARPAYVAETTLEEIRGVLGSIRVVDYQIVNGKGEIQAEHSLYLNPPGGYLLSDAFREVRNLDGGIVGYPYQIGEEKAVYPRMGKVIPVSEPPGGFYQLHYYPKGAIDWYMGLWTPESPHEITIQIFLFREDGNYQPHQAYILPEDRLIKEPEDYDFEVWFTFRELRDALGDGNAYYVRLLDDHGNIVGEDYFYFIPAAEPEK